MPRTRFRLQTFALAILLPALTALGTHAAPKAARARPPLALAAPLPFLAGADLSELPVHEQQGVRYSDHGAPADLLVIARRNHWQVVRVRLWVDPAPTPESRVSDLPHVAALGKRIKDAGLKFLLDIHYSDTWADPAHQHKPAAWEALSFPALVQKVHDYTQDALVRLRAGGAAPDLVQIGNETRNGLLCGSGLDGAGPQPGGGFWEPGGGGIDRAARLLAAGLAGVRDNAPPRARPPLTILHVPDGQDTGFVRWYFTTLQAHADALVPPADLRFDMVGLSYYPADAWWVKNGFEPLHLSHLSATMAYVATVLRKPALVAETNWPQAGTPRAAAGAPEFAFTPDGQAQFYHALLGAVRAVPGGRGAGVVAWDVDTLHWNSLFDAQGRALPAVRALGAP